MDIIWTGAFARRIIYNRVYTRKDDQVASDGKRFTHIAVNDDDGDIVIQAGAPAAEPPCAEAQPTEPLPSESEGEGREEVGEPAFEAAHALEAPVPVDAASEAEAPADVPVPEASEDDLAAPMSNMQKVIIAAALVLVVLFVVYVNFLR